MSDDFELHIRNMSAPPKSVVKYAGLASVAEVGGRRKARSRDVFGAAVAFRLPTNLRRVDAATLLDVIGEERGEGAPETRLLRLIEDRARELAIPDGAVVIPVRPDHRAPWPDTLAAIAVITKSSDTIWLRGKTPRLSPRRTPASAVVVDEDVRKNPKNPGNEVRSRLKLMEFLVHPDRSVLDQVFGGRRVSRHSHGRSVQGVQQRDQFFFEHSLPLSVIHAHRASPPFPEDWHKHVSCHDRAIYLMVWVPVDG